MECWDQWKEQGVEGWSGRAITFTMRVSTASTSLSLKETPRHPRTTLLTSRGTLAIIDRRKKTKRTECARFREITVSKKPKMIYSLWDTKNLLKKKVINSGLCQGTWQISCFKIFPKDSLETCSPNSTKSNLRRPRYPSTMWCLSTSSSTKISKWESTIC